MSDAAFRIQSAQQLYLQQLIFIQYYRLFLFSRLLLLRRLALEKSEISAGSAPEYKDPTGHNAVGDFFRSLGQIANAPYKPPKDYAASQSTTAGQTSPTKAQVESKLQQTGTGGQDRVSKLHIRTIIRGNENNEHGKGIGVTGDVEYTLIRPDGSVLTHKTEGVYWANNREGGERPTYETKDPVKLTVIAGRDKYNGGNKAKDVTHRIHYDGKEKEIFIHAGFHSNGCHCVGGGEKAKNFLNELETAMGSKNFVGATHEIVDKRDPDLKAVRPGQETTDIK